MNTSSACECDRLRQLLAQERERSNRIFEHVRRAAAERDEARRQLRLMQARATDPC